MKITNVSAYPISFPIPPELQVTLGIGRAIKRDAVLVKVETDGGIVGWGESHAARAPTALAELVNTTLRQLVVEMPADDIDAVLDQAGIPDIGKPTTKIFMSHCNRTLKGLCPKARCDGLVALT